MWRRIRGLVGSMVIWAVPWSLIGTAIGIAIRMQWPEGREAYTVFGGLVISCAAIGGILGAINGGAFALSVMATQRRRRLGDVPLWQFAVLGASVAAVTSVIIDAPLVIACLATGAGAAVSAGSLSIARRGAVIDAGDRRDALAGGQRTRNGVDVSPS